MSLDSTSNDCFDKAALRRRETLARSSRILGLVKDAHVFRLALFASTGCCHPISIPVEYTVDLLEAYQGKQ
jgi:hypothetical protein